MEIKMYLNQKKNRDESHSIRQYQGEDKISGLGGKIDIKGKKQKNP
jgi:hypothetical protein